MASAPRQGRKGGKITSSPAIAAQDPSPAVLSPGTQLAGGAFPNDPSSELEFDLEALLKTKKAKAASPVATTTTAAAAATPVTTEDNVFKFDINSIEQVAQGTVIGGNKAFRADSHAPTATVEEVSQKVTSLFEKKDTTNVENSVNNISEAVSALKDIPVLTSRHPRTLIKIAVATVELVKDSKVMVVVPRYFEVHPMAEELRRVKSVTGGATFEVGELVGQNFCGEEGCRIWVTSADTALLYLHNQKSLSPFTHLVVPGLSRMTPLMSYFLWGLRERVFRQSPNLDVNAPKLHLALCVSESIKERVGDFFAELETKELEKESPNNSVVFSYDECNALAEVNVLDVAIDKTGKFPGPHRKLVEHTTKVAVNILRKLADKAEEKFCAYVFSADVKEVVDALVQGNLKDTQVHAGHIVVGEDAEEEGKASAKNRVYVVHHSTSLPQADVEGQKIQFVFDMGTTRQFLTQSKSESFIGATVTEWASKADIEERKQMLGEAKVGGYFTLYPIAAEEVFTQKDVNQCILSEVEDALLHCLRAEMPLEVAVDPILPVSKDILELAIGDLCEKCFVADLSGKNITFLGEVACRLPLDIDLAYYVISGCAMGLGGAAACVAAVCALPFAEFDKGSEKVLEGRKKYAGDISRQSDVLCDALIYLEWAKLKLQNEPVEAFLAEVNVRESKLEQAQVLLNYILSQLSDYCFVELLDCVANIEAVGEAIRKRTSILIFIEAASLARRTFFVRTSGQLNAKDRTGAFVFVRTSKKVVPNTNVASSVPWDLSAALVPIDIRNLPNMMLVSRSSVISMSYLFSSFLLFSPQVEFSGPTETNKGRVVYFGITVNHQMKRFSVSIEEAATILDFREKWNLALGYLAALRQTVRPISKRRFILELKNVDRLFQLDDFYTEIQREALNLVTELDVSEHQGSFVTKSVHSFAPKPILPESAQPELAMDVIVTKKFHSGDLWKPHSPSIKTPSTQTTLASPASAFPTHNLGPYIEEDDDDVEVIEENFFAKHGPIVEDD